MLMRIVLDKNQEHRKRLDDLRNMLRQESAREIRLEIRRDIRKEVAAKVKNDQGRTIGQACFWLL